MKLKGRTILPVVLCAAFSILALASAAKNIDSSMEVESSSAPAALLKELQQYTSTLQQIEFAFHSQSNMMESSLDRALNKIDVYRIDTASRLRRLGPNEDPKIITSDYYKRSFEALYTETESTRFLVSQNLSQALRVLTLLKKTDSASGVVDEYSGLLKNLASNLYSLGIDLTLPSPHAGSGNSQLLLAKGFLFGRTPEEAEYALQKTLDSF